MTDPTFLVVWRDDNQYMQSEVSLGVCDPRQMTNNDWVKAAALSEDYTEAEAEELLERGYDLLLVSDFPATFYDQ